jgi:hypothetical protein
MKPLAALINIIAFTALFIAYAGSISLEKPAGVRRALQTYAGQTMADAFPSVKSVREIGVDIGSLA